jgi:hypothetical protein
VFAGNTAGDRITGIGAVVLFLVSEFLSDHMVTRDKANAAAAAAAAEQIIQAEANLMAACTHPTKCNSTEQCNSKTVAAQKRSKTVARKNRQRKSQERALETLVR